MWKKSFFTFVFSVVIIQYSFSQWLQVSDGIGTSQLVNAFTVSGANILAGTYTGVYISTNNGNSWTQTNLNNKGVLSFTLTADYIFAGTNISGVYLSSNNGISWIQTALDTHFVYSVAAIGSNVFAGTNGSGIYLSTNNGTTWTQTSLKNKEIRCLAVSVNYILAGANDGVYFSTNNGTNWIQSSLNNRRIYSLTVNENNVFAGAFDLLNTNDRGVYRSTNNGANWMLIGINTISIRSLAIDDNNLFAGTENNGVYLTKNYGVNWFNRNQGFCNILSVSSLLIYNNYIFAGTWGYSVWRRLLSETLSENSISTIIPLNCSLSQNYPNPFNPVTRIDFDIPKKGFVSLRVYNVLGREVQTLVNEEKQAGSYSVDFDGSELTSGVYFYKLEVDGFTDVKRMMLIK